MYEYINIYIYKKIYNVCTKRPIVYHINNRIIMNFGNLLFQHPYNIRKQIRNIETNEKKLIQANIAVVFNNTRINIIIIYHGFLPL